MVAAFGLLGAGTLPAVARAEDGLTIDLLKKGSSASVAAPHVPDPSATTRPALLLDSAAADHLAFSFQLPIWTAGLDGSFGVRGFTASVHRSFLDMLDNTDTLVGLEGRFEATYGP